VRVLRPGQSVPASTHGGRVLAGERAALVDQIKSDPVSLDTVSTTMTAAKEAGHAGQAAEGNDSSW